MRVLHIVRQFSPAVGGLENFVKSLVLEQRRNGIDASVLTLDRVFHQVGPQLANVDAVEGIPVTRINYRGSYKYPLAPSVLRYLKGYDLVHVHGVDFFADFLAITAPFHRHKLVISTHGGFFHTPYASKLKQLFFNTVTRFSLKAYLKVFACSNNDYQRFAPICSNRLALIDNGVDTEKFANAASKQHQPTMIFIGRFSDNKRIDKLITMMSELLQLTPLAQLLIIGKDWDGNEQRLQQQIETNQLSNHVTILTGLSDQQIKQRIASANYVISASEYEGFGLTLIEGMAAGLLPLASPIPSFTRIVDQAQLGQIVNFDKPAQAANQIANYMDEVAGNFSSLRQAAIDRAAVYAWPAVAQTFLQQYQRLGCEPRVLQGITIDSRSGDEIIATIDSAIEQQKPLRLAYANAHTVNLARESEQFQQALSRCLVINDGVGVSIASKWKYGQGFSENLNGTDFTPRFLAGSTTPLKVFLLGAQPDSVQRCFEVWQKAYPQHQWVGYHHGYFDDNDAICDQIKQSGANLVIAAMGNPKQELWLDQYLTKTGATVGIGVGALFDFTAGNVKRAPSWMRQVKVEWIYRLLQEPKRMWRRYLLGNAAFLYHTFRDNS